MRTARVTRLAFAITLVTLAAIVGAAPASAARSCHGQAATIVGTRGGDDLRGTSGDDVIVGLGGDDVIRGQGGNDVLCGSSGADRLLGGGGLDSLDGGDDDDEVNGGGGADVVFGDDGTDALDGGGGINELSFARSPNGVTVDLFAGTAEGLGTDTITGFGTVTGSDHDDTVTGGRNDETLIGGGGDDVLSGGPGEDALEGGDGNDQLEGGPGVQNSVTYARAPAGVAVNLQAGTATGWGTDTLAAIQLVIGSSFDDAIIGNGQRNTFFLGEGNDSVSGGGGPDTVDFSAASNGVIVDLEAGTATGQGTDTVTEVAVVIGSEFGDTLIGNDRGNTLNGGPGDDALFGNEGNDTLDGGEGTDTLDGGPRTDTCLNGETVIACEA